MPKKKEVNNHNLLKGVVAGAAVIGGAALAAVALSDEKNREKLADGAEKLRDKGEDFLNDAYKEAAKQFEELKKKVEAWVEEGKKTDEYKKVLEGIDKVADKLSDAKESSGKDLDRVVAEVKKSVEELRSEFDELAKA